MKKFEYFIERTQRDYAPDITQLGLEGWELVAVVAIHSEEGFQDYKYFFKREVKNK